MDIFRLRGEVEVDPSRASGALLRIDGEARATDRVLRQTGATGRALRGDFGQAAGGLEQAASAAGRLRNALAGLRGAGGGGGGGLGNLLSVTGGNLVSGAITSALGGVTNALQQGWAAGIEYNKMLETASVGFTTMLGSAQAASRHLKELEDFGQRTPFEFPDLIKASQRMQAMGFAADKVLPSLQSIGDAVSAAGGGREELEGVVRALGQMQTKGKVSAEEMNQLAERGIPAWDLLAKAIGRTKAETMKLSEQGRLNGNVAVEGILAMMSERYGGQMGRMMGTLAGQESNFQDIRNKRLGQATQANFEQLRGLYGSLGTSLSSTQGEQFAAEMNKLLGTVGAEAQQAIVALTDPEKIRAAAEFARKTQPVAAAASSTLSDAVTKGQAGFMPDVRDVGKKGWFDEQLDDFRKMGAALQRLFGGTGSQAGQSFADGLQSGAPGAGAAGQAVGKAAEQGVRQALDQHSPSRVMTALGREAGQSFSDGFTSGVNQTIDRSSAGMKKWAAAIERAGGEEFLQAVEAMARRLKLDPNKLMNVMAFESRLSPSTKAQHSSGSGLIQFMGGRQGSAAALGTTPEKLRAMTALEQLKYVEAYFRQFGQLADTQEAVYTAVLRGRPTSDPNKVLFTDRGRRVLSDPYYANRALDKDQSGTITAREAAAQVYKQGFLSAGVAGRFEASVDKLSNGLGEFVAGMRAVLQARAGAAAAAAAAPAPVTVTVTARAGQGGGGRTIQGGEIVTEVAGKLGDELLPTLGALPPEFNRLSTETKAARAALEQGGSQAGKFAHAITEAADKTEEAAERVDRFGEALGRTFDDIFDGLLDGNLDGKRIAKNLFKDISAAMIGNATGGKYNSPGQALGGWLSGALGLGGRGLAGEAGNTATGNGAQNTDTAASAAGGAASNLLGQGLGTVGGLLNRVGVKPKMVGGLPVLPGVKIPPLGGASGTGGMWGWLGKLGAKLGLGGGAAGATAGAGAAAGGGASTGLLAALGFSNPISAVITGSMLAMPLLLKAADNKVLNKILTIPALINLVRHDWRKSLVRQIRAEYGLDVKRNDTILEQIKQLGEQKFGPREFPKRHAETVRLPETRELLSEYAQARGLKGNSNLFSAGLLQDAYAKMNLMKRATGGPLFAGQPTLVGERGPELITPTSGGYVWNAQQTERALRGGAGGPGGADTAAALAALTREVAALAGAAGELYQASDRIGRAAGRLESHPPGHVVTAGLRERPEAAAGAVVADFERNGPHSERIRNRLNKR